MNATKTLSLIVALLLVGMAPWAEAVQISTEVGAGADIQLTEQEDGADGADDDMNTRWNAEDRNEAVGLRFDLAGVDLSSISSASLNLFNFRTNDTRYIDVYAVPVGTTGGSGAYTTETWSEGGVTTWGDFPGCFVSDGSNCVTFSVDTNNLLRVVNDYTVIVTNEGEVASASSPALVQFLKDLTNSTTATFLVTQGSGTSGGQFRFASKEAEMLTTIAGSAGDFAPFLELAASVAVAGTNRVSTADGVGADMAMQEHNDRGIGGNPTAAVRWKALAGADGRNEAIGLRFDLTGYDLSTVQSASLNLINARNNGEKLVDVYAVTPGATGGSGLYDTETWSDVSLPDWGDFPGLLMSDGSNCTTISINTNVLTLLLDESLGAPTSEGSVLSLSSPAMTDYLRNHTDATITLLITGADDDSNNQRRYTTKEATATEGGVLTGPVGSLAPYLEFVIPVARPAMDGIALDAGPSVVVSWEALPNHTYGVERAVEDLSVSNWVGVASNLAGASVNTYTDTVPVEVQVSYRVVDEGALPPEEYFFDDFEDDPTGDWTVQTNDGHAVGTDWEWGTPIAYAGSNGSPPDGAQDGTGAYGTNREADYASDANTSLLSPVIDLTAASAATLSFGNYFDLEGFISADYGSVYVRDASGGEIAGLESPLATYYTFITAWRTEEIPLPATALGQSIRLEFRFISDGFSEYAGWYIDNVRVAE